MRTSEAAGSRGPAGTAREAATDADPPPAVCPRRAPTVVSLPASWRRRCRAELASVGVGGGGVGVGRGGGGGGGDDNNPWAEEGDDDVRIILGRLKTLRGGVDAAAAAEEPEAPVAELAAEPEAEPEAGEGVGRRRVLEAPPPPWVVDRCRDPAGLPRATSLPLDAVEVFPFFAPRDSWRGGGGTQARFKGDS